MVVLKILDQVAPLAVVSVVMSSDSDNSVSLSGSESELDSTILKASWITIFQLKFSITVCKQPTTAIILPNLMRQMLALREATKILVSIMKFFFPQKQFNKSSATFILAPTTLEFHRKTMRTLTVFIKSGHISTTWLVNSEASTTVVRS